MPISYLIIGLIIVIISISIYFLRRSLHVNGKQEKNMKNQDNSYMREIIDRDRQIINLNLKINKLVELNSRYLSFMFKIPYIIQRLNTTLILQEIIVSIIEMVKNIVLTDKIGVYLFDALSNKLNRVYMNGMPQQEIDSYALGEDLIGAVAKHRFIMMREDFSRMYPQKQSDRNAKTQFWMAVPIIFKDRLLGVIGIGEIENPIGNESELLKMIADISGVALFNQILLNDAQHKANTDPLTGLNNRNYFFQMAQHYVEKSSHDGTVISLFLLDIDNFKHYNDTNGHDAGDKLLIEISKLIRSSSRKNSIVARYGGEEFIVMLPGIAKEDAYIYADRLREQISHYTFNYFEKQPLGFVSISGGVATFPEDGDTINKVINCADLALYEAKSKGKNRVMVYKAP